MNISNSIDGINSAFSTMNQATDNIVAKTDSGSGEDITSDILKQKEASIELSANVRVAKVQDRMLGEVIDLLA